MKKKDKAEKKPAKVDGIVSEKYAMRVFTLSDVVTKKFDSKDFISTGSRVLNDAISGNYKCGLPRGRVAEIYGPESSGKTTVAVSVCVEDNKNGNDTLYIDAEHGLDLHYAKALGIDPKRFHLSQPDCGEDAFEIAFDAIEQKKVSLIVFDSVSSLVPRAELEGSMDDKNMGLHARLMGQGLRKLSVLVNRNRVACFFINQIRMKIGGYGNPETTPGGLALKFYAWVRIMIRSPRSGKIIGKGSLDDLESKKAREVGTEANCTIVKNKIFMPHGECTFNINYGKGIDKNDDFVRLLDLKGIVSMEGAKVIYRKKSMLRDSFFKRMEEKAFRIQIFTELSK